MAIEKGSQQEVFQMHADVFGAFLRNTDQKPVQLAATLKGLRTEFPAVWSRVMSPDKEFHGVFIGAGNGVPERMLVKEMITARGSSSGINVYLMDTSQQLGLEYLMAVQGDEQLSGITREYQIHSFESDNYSIPHPADIALASHVFYYIPIDEANLKKFSDGISPQGVGLITLQSETSDNFAIRSKYSPKVYPGSEERYGEEISEVLDASGIDYKSQVVECHTDISSCFDERGGFNPNVEGKLLLSFLLRASWDTVSPAIQHELAKDLSVIAEKNKLVGYEKPTMVFRDLFVWIPGVDNKQP